MRKRFQARFFFFLHCVPSVKAPSVAFHTAEGGSLTTRVRTRVVLRFWFSFNTVLIPDGRHVSFFRFFLLLNVNCIHSQLPGDIHLSLDLLHLAVRRFPFPVPDGPRQFPYLWESVFFIPAHFPLAPSEGFGREKERPQNFLANNNNNN